MKYKILHTADIQVNIRDKNLKRSFEKSLENIYNIVRDEKVDIYTIVGDLFEYALANEAETKIMYYHLSRVITLDTVKELVIMSGNHDLVKEHHTVENQENENKINTFVHTLKALNTNHGHKITYLKYSDIVASKATSNLVYVPYSLEDGMAMLDKDVEKEMLLNKENYYISFFHDIVQDYAIQTKLPIQKQKLESLVNVDKFKTRFVLAGDIHVFWDCVGEAGQHFLYPGSPIQRNFGEGEYVKIGDTSLDIKGDTKKVRIYTFNSHLLEFKQEEPIELQDYVSYVTFEIMKNVSFDVAYKGISEMLSQITYGNEQTYIKLKLSNLFLSHEMDFHKLITTQTANHKRVQLEISYDKFINTQQQTNINNILGDAKKGSDEVLDASTQPQLDNQEDQVGIDSLVLDSAKLRKLFMYVLDSRMEKVVKEFPNDEIFIEKVYTKTASIFDEQLTECLSEMKKVNIQFERIECNGFMILGQNSINLKVPGITRISGTNGVGKTTLYNMLRWVIRNEIYEGMPKNRVKQNTMGVFNNKNPEQDTIMVKLNQTVNGVEVAITRTASRVWKRNATDEQKISLNWSEYIQSINCDLSIVINGSKGVREFVGDQAQAYLDSWFGKTPETILFLNYTKILSMLNTAPKELNETVLDFIGVDYLKTLEQNVEAVKLELMVEKPKRTKEVIIEELQTLNDRIVIHNKTNEELEIQLLDVNNNIKIFGEELVKVNNDLINVGDYPYLISEATERVNNLAIQIQNFETKEVNPHIAFGDIEPEKYDATIDTKELQGSELMVEEFTQQLTEEQTLLEEKSLKLETVYDLLIKQLVAKEQTNTNDLKEANDKLNGCTTEIINLQSKIKSSVCTECKRPYGTPEEYAKKQIEWQQQLDDLNIRKEKLNVERGGFVELGEKIKNALSKNREKHTSSVRRVFTFIEDNVKIQPLLDEIIILSNKCLTISKKRDEALTSADKIRKYINEKNTQYTTALSEFYERKKIVDQLNADIDVSNKSVEEHNNSIKDLQIELGLEQQNKIIVEAKKPEYDGAILRRSDITSSIELVELRKVELQSRIGNTANSISEIKNRIFLVDVELANLYQYISNNTIFKIYNTLIKDDFKGIVFEYYRNFLNNELNNLLEDVNFKLFWNADNELFMVKMENGVCSYTPVQQTSGMEVVFLGLSLIYTMSILNIRNSISSIFIDELSGQLNKGDQLGYKAKNYQELFVSILGKFKNKQVVIVDHNIRNLYETINYEVVPTETGSVYQAK